MKSLNKILIAALVFLLTAVVANAQLPGTNKAYMDNMKIVDSVLVASVWQPVFGIFSGDLNQNGYIDFEDIPILTSGIEDPFPYGYLDADLNGDGYVDFVDIPVLTTNIELSITMMRPY